MSVAGRPRPDASMSLLRELLANPLDAEYRAVAERRQLRADRPYPWWQRVFVLLVCAVVGAGSVWAAKELRAPVGDHLQARALLEEQIAERSAEGEAMREANTEVVAEISQLQTEALTGADQSFLDYLQNLGVAAGGVPVRGPGLEFRLDDSRASQQGARDSDDGRVQDIDLQVIVNGLWAAGAEAVAINGHRLTATSAIRSAGPAIFVDLNPVVRPYTIKAIGDPAELEVGLARTNAAGHIVALRETYDITVDIGQAEELTLPGTSMRSLRYATPNRVSESGEDVALGPPDVSKSGGPQSSNAVGEVS